RPAAQVLTLFPYTTLFRSGGDQTGDGHLGIISFLRALKRFIEVSDELVGFVLFAEDFTKQCRLVTELLVEFTGFSFNVGVDDRYVTSRSAGEGFAVLAKALAVQYQIWVCRGHRTHIW